MAEQWLPYGWSVEAVQLAGTPGRLAADRTCGLKGMGTVHAGSAPLTTVARTVIRSGPA
jgi:hypothetical protein